MKVHTEKDHFLAFVSRAALGATEARGREKERADPRELGRDLEARIL